jgi:hypothetical protein
MVQLAAPNHTIAAREKAGVLMEERPGQKCAISVMRAVYVLLFVHQQQQQQQQQLETLEARS